MIDAGADIIDLEAIQQDQDQNYISKNRVKRVKILEKLKKNFKNFIIN